MPYSILEHTADVRMRVEGNTKEELFRDAVLGMMSIIGGGPDGEGEKVVAMINITLTAPDQTSLLVDFLNEVLSQSHIQRQIYSKVIFKELTKTSLTAKLTGMSSEKFEEDIKAVTYHGANVLKDEAGNWEVTLIFDI